MQVVREIKFLTDNHKIIDTILKVIIILILFYCQLAKASVIHLGFPVINYTEVMKLIV